MTQNHEDLKDLAALTELHLLQEYSRHDRIMTSRESYEYFKQYALRKRASPQPPPQPIALKPPQKKPSPPKPLPQKETTKKPEPSKEPSKPSLSFELTPPGSPPTTDFSDIRQVLSKKFPSQKILDDLPDDTAAKQIRRQWADNKKNPEIILLYSNEPAQQRSFLSNLAKAIDVCVGSSSVVSANDPNLENLLKSPKLRLILCSGAHLNAIDSGKTATLALSDLNDYLKNPQLKAELWKKLKKSS
ncbi:MAG: hypothetical protein ACE5GN_00460 [Waddliaceae bacterium]